MIKLSSSLEDYLGAISDIIEVRGHAHTKDIAEKLKVKMPSVTNALQTLAAHGLIRYQSHCPVVLTALGAEMAAVIKHRHTLLRCFFSDILKMDSGESDRIACKIEHVVGEETISRLAALYEAITEREDCAGLREHIEKLMPQLTVEEAEDLVQLSELQVDESAVVVRVGENLRGIKKFADLGMVTGTLIQIEGHAPLGNLIRVRIMGSSLSIRKDDAAYIWVKKTE